MMLKPNAVVRIASLDGREYGLGMALESGDILTCAHVACDVLGIDRYSERPAEQTRIGVRSWSGDRSIIPSMISAWSPSDQADLALLSPQTKIPDGILPAPIALTDNDAPGWFYGPAIGGRIATCRIVGDLGDGFIQVVRPDKAGYWIEPGTSGSPVFDSYSRVIGLVRSMDSSQDLDVGKLTSANNVAELTGIVVEDSVPEDETIRQIRADVFGGAFVELDRFDPPFRPWVSSKEVSFESLPDVFESTDSRRVLLTGDGGSGKSQILASTVLALAPKGYLPIWVDLSGWTEESTQELGQADDSSERMEVLLGYTRHGEMSVRTLEDLRELDVQIALVIDSLNEVGEPRDLPEVHPRITILKSADDFLRRQFTNRAICIVATRPIRVDAERWLSVTVDGLAEDAVLDALRKNGILDDDQVPSDRSMDLLRSPFFLDSALQSRSIDFANTLEALEQRIHRPSRSLSSLALEMYQTHRSTSVAAEKVEAHLSSLAEDDLEWLRVPTTEKVRFVHQLVNDYFAANAIVAKWSGSDGAAEGDPIDDEWLDIFDGASFGGIESDCLLMAIDSLAESHPSRVVHLLTWIYDWNYNVALDALASPLEVPGAEELAYVIGALRSERRFDRVGETARRATESLQRLTERYPNLDGLEAADRQALIAIVSNDFEPKSEWAKVWKAVYTEALTPAEILDCVRDPYSIVGWTAANVLKRVGIDSHVEQVAQTYLTAFRVPMAVDGAYHKTVRWRLVYVLGTGKGSRTVDLLFEGLEDIYPWVRSGSLRSLVEHLSSNAPASSGLILERLTSLVPRFDRRLRTRLASSLSSDGNASWLEARTTLRDALVVASSSDEAELYLADWSIENSDG